MYKDDEEEKSLNKDLLTFFDLDESLDIEDIPTIDEILSIDEDEVEQIQKISSSSDDNENIKKEFDPLNSDTPQDDSESGIEKNAISASETDDLNENFDNLANDIESFENDAVLDEPVLNAEAADVEAETVNLQDFEENVSDQNVFQPEFTDNVKEENISDESLSDFANVQTEEISSDKVNEEEEEEEEEISNKTEDNVTFDNEFTEQQEDAQSDEQKIDVDDTSSENNTENSFADNILENFNYNETGQDTGTNFSANIENEENNSDSAVQDFIFENTEAIPVIQSEQSGDVFDRIEALLNVDITDFSTDADIPETAYIENISEDVKDNNNYGDTTEDVAFTNIANLEEQSLALTDSQNNTFDDITETVSSVSISDLEELPKEQTQPKYQSAFNPIKYMQETSSDKENFDSNDVTNLPYPEEAMSDSEEIILERDDTSAEYEQAASLMNEYTDDKEVLEFLYNEDADNTTDNFFTQEEENAEADENNSELNLDEVSAEDSILTNGKAKKIILAAAVCAVLLGAGITAISVFNRKSAEEIAELNKNDAATPLEAVNTPDAVPPVVIEKNTNVDADIPDINAVKQPKVAVVEQDVIKQEIQKHTTPVNPESYLSVSKIQWQVPHYLSYSSNMNSYLQTAGKSIKMQLLSDLLLVNEYAYSNIVKVNLKLNKTGTLQDTNILTSSGSKQIDNIVLQSVKSTLNVVKPPVDEVQTPEFNLTITIYF